MEFEADVGTNKTIGMKINPRIILKNSKAIYIIITIIGLNPVSRMRLIVIATVAIVSNPNNISSVEIITMDDVELFANNDNGFDNNVVLIIDIRFIFQFSGKGLRQYHMIANIIGPV